MADPIDFKAIVDGALAPSDPLEEYAEEIAAAERAEAEKNAKYALEQARRDWKKYMMANGYGIATNSNIGAVSFQRFLRDVLSLPPAMIEAIERELKRQNEEYKKTQAMIQYSQMDMSQMDMSALEKYMTQMPSSQLQNMWYDEASYGGIVSTGVKPLKYSRKTRALAAPTHPTSPRDSFKHGKYRK